MPDLVIRPAVQEDLDVLWDFLAMAAYEPHAEAAKAVPFVAKYLVGWQRPGDFGFIAEQHGEILGAAWARRFSTRAGRCWGLGRHRLLLSLHVQVRIPALEETV